MQTGLSLDEVQKIAESGSQTRFAKVSRDTVLALEKLHYAVKDAKSYHDSYREAVEHMEALEAKCGDADREVMDAQVALRHTLELE